MQKYTHLIFAFLLFILFNFIFHFPIYLSLFAFLGAMLPDLDIKIKKMHRKIFHNIWFLLITLTLLFKLGLIDRTIAIIFSIGFISHLIADSLTHTGIMPFWPIEKPRFSGPFRTGSLGEFGLMIIMIIVILLAGKFI